MSFPRYPEYKDSGMEWLGDVPGHWDVSSFRHCLSHMFNGLTATQVDEAENTVPVTRIETISYGVIDESKLGFINSNEARADRALVPGDILFSNINSLNMVGKCAFYPGGRTIYAGMNLLVLRPATAKCDPLWLCWLVRSASFRDVVESLAKPAINQASVSQSSINSITVACPPLNEQTEIAAFLDRETATIDALVAEQRRLMELLKEKRQAVISHAVTRGLNPDAPMKPSGIEWLGDVPQHWDVSPLRRLASKGTSITYGIVQAGPDVEGGIPYIRTSDMSGELLPLEGYMRTTPEIDASYSRSKVKPNDLVVAIRASVGKGLLVPESLDGANLTQGTARIAPGDSLQPKFLYWAFNSRYCQTSIKVVAKGSIFLEITLDALRRIQLAVPPLDEQDAIVSYLDQFISQFDTLTTEAQRAIDLLQERRTTLISAAVIGQIDVRNTVLT